MSTIKINLLGTQVRATGSRGSSEKTGTTHEGHL